MLEASLLARDVIICCGEDDQEMLAALSSTGAGLPLQEHEYRSYKVRRFARFTVILSGIGTGCLEPLLYEILEFGVARRLVLVGTAGQITGSRTRVGEAYVIDRAYVAGTGVDREVGPGPLFPDFGLADGAYECAGIVSTDFYYGFSDNPAHARYRRSLPKLREDFARLRRVVDLVDMEVGQFYAFCRMMSSGSGVQYIAVKGPANTLADQQEQNLHAGSVLSKAFSIAFQLLAS